jgi:hypothetical protein
MNTFSKSLESVVTRKRWILFWLSWHLFLKKMQREGRDGNHGDDFEKNSQGQRICHVAIRNEHRLCQH